MAFDPYRQWFGIDPREWQEQAAPDHYRLLGIQRFESSQQVIETAVEQRVAFLHEVASGDHSAESQQLLNLVAQARLCLLAPQSKQEYDLWLKQAASAAGSGAGHASNKNASKHPQRPQHPKRLPAAAQPLQVNWLPKLPLALGCLAGILVSSLVITLGFPGAFSSPPDLAGKLPDSKLGGGAEQANQTLQQAQKTGSQTATGQSTEGGLEPDGVGIVGEVGGSDIGPTERPDADNSASGSAMLPDASTKLNSVQIDYGLQLPLPAQLPLVAEEPLPTNGLQLWLDADAGETVLLAAQNEAAQRVAVWYDLSGNGNNLVQVNQQMRPTTVLEHFPSAHRTAIRFDPASRQTMQLLSGKRIDLGRDFTIALVGYGKRVALGQGKPNDPEQRGFVLRELNKLRYMKNESDRYVDFVIESQPAESAHIRVLVVKDSIPQWIDDTGEPAGQFVVGSTPEANAREISRLDVSGGEPLVLGRQINWNQSYFDGAIGELIVFDRALNSSELATLQAYLEAKWLAESGPNQ